VFTKVCVCFGYVLKRRLRNKERMKLGSKLAFIGSENEIKKIFNPPDLIQESSFRSQERVLIARSVLCSKYFHIA